MFNLQDLKFLYQLRKSIQNSYSSVAEAVQEVFLRIKLFFLTQISSFFQSVLHENCTISLIPFNSTPPPPNATKICGWAPFGKYYSTNHCLWHQHLRNYMKTFCHY